MLLLLYYMLSDKTAK